MGNVGWVITKDHLMSQDTSEEGKGQTEADFQRRTWMRYWISEDLLPGSIEDPVRFQIKDDDGELYYSGVMNPAWYDSSDEDRVGAPLKWAELNAGATEFWVLEDGKWELIIG